MAAVCEDPPSPRSGSPAPDSRPAVGRRAPQVMARCFSTGSAISHGSATSSEASHLRESYGSNASASSRHSTGSYPPLGRTDTGAAADTQVNGRRSTSRRRGYMRPQGTDFAASARARESVLSLGSIAHLQYYFARTGLLDGKGGRLMRKRENRPQTLDLSALDPSAFLSPKTLGSDHDSSYASMGSSPDLTIQSGFTNTTLGTGSLVESPVEDHAGAEQQDEEFFEDEFDEHMLPPTTSTYNHREKPLPKPPTMAELRSELTRSLGVAAQTLKEARAARPPAETVTIHVESASQPPDAPPVPEERRRPSIFQPDADAGWYEIQGMSVLDVMTLAIRAAKIYYTSHDRPDRLDAIKSEKQLRGELLSVMDILKRMATRLFTGGMREEEFRTMESWIDGVRAMLAAEDRLEAAEIAERKTWTWMHPEGWEGREFEREEAFMRSMLKGPDPIANMPFLPKWTPIDRSRPLDAQSLPTPFLAALSNGQRLVQLHNCAVNKSRRRFGAIPTFYADTQKPYRAADNLRYWLKAAELRWEVLLKADPLGLQYNTRPELWVEFEDAVLQWCRKVRQEIVTELQEPEQD